MNEATEKLKGALDLLLEVELLLPEVLKYEYVLVLEQAEVRIMDTMKAIGEK